MSRPAVSDANVVNLHDVCVVGSANLDVVTRVARLPGPGETVHGRSLSEYPGGKGLNQAVAAARSGARTSFVGAVGDDEAGLMLRRVLTDDGIIDHLIVTDHPSGRAIILVDDQAENSIVVVAGANSSVDANTLPTARCMLAQLEIPIDTVIAAFTQARAAGATTILNPAPASVLPAELLELTDVLIPNEHELELAGGTDRALTAGCRAVLVTLGAKGAQLATSDGRFDIEPFRVEAADTTGAGDAFCGSFAARLAAGDDLDSAARWAAAAGALATTVPGAVPAQPRAASIRRLLATPNS